MQERRDGRAPLPQRLGVRRQQDHIVDIAQVLLALQGALDEVVQVVEIDVAPELAGQVANGQTPFVVLPEEALVRRHRVVRAAGAGAAGVAGLKVVIGGGIVEQQRARQPAQLGMAEVARQDRGQRGFVDGGEKIRHVQL